MPEERIHGPYKHGARWRVVVVATDGTRSHPRESEGGPSGFASRESAEEYVAAWRGEDEPTIAAAVDAYIESMRSGGYREDSVTTTAFRLRALLQTTGRDRRLRALTPAVARDLFAARAAASGDTQAGELGNGHRFAAWAIGQGWLSRDPFVGLAPTKPKSRARRKQQHRIDEARRFLDVALAHGEEGLAAAIALLMDLRASEIVKRRVRDVDDDGRVLVIEEAKTEAGERRLEIPDEIHAAIVGRCTDRRPEDLLFPGRSRHWVGYHVRRLCRIAGVPVISPHGLRRTHSSISVREVSIEHVAAALGHASPAVTRRHYIAPGAEQDGRQRSLLRVLAGGRR